MSAKKWLNANISSCLTEANDYEIWSFYVFSVADQLESSLLDSLHLYLQPGTQQERYLSFPPWVWRQRKMIF